MKIVRTNIFFFLLGAIIFSFITAYAISINSRDVSYNGTNVKNALDGLYANANINILDRLNLSSDKITYNESYGIRTPDRATSLDLNTGSYLVFVNFHYTGGITGTSMVENNSRIISLTYNNGDCTRLSGRKLYSYIAPFSTSNSSTNYASYETVAIYSCKFTGNTTLNILNSESPGQNNYHESHIMAQAIKLD